MRRSMKAKKQSILNALLQGRKLTPREADNIADTTEGTRLIRFIREKYPVKDERVEGEVYHRYWIDEDFLAKYREELLSVGNV
jgi:hypothetical protein